MSDARLKKLQAAWAEMERMDESATYKGSAKGGITPKQDTNSKPVAGVSREEGAKDGLKKAVDGGDKHGNAGSVNDKVKPVDREEGVKAGAKEVGKEHGDKKAVDGANPVAREEGAASGKSEVGEYGDHESFRKRIKAALGLDLNDKLNQGYGKDRGVPAGKSAKK